MCDKWDAMRVAAHQGGAMVLFTLALGLGLAYELSGSLLVPIAMHSLWR